MPRINVKRILFGLAIGLACVNSTKAQGPGDPDTPESGTDPIPLDGGISLLLAAGAAYGIKKVRDFRKNGESE